MQADDCVGSLDADPGCRSGQLLRIAGGDRAVGAREHPSSALFGDVDRLGFAAALRRNGIGRSFVAPVSQPHAARTDIPGLASADGAVDDGLRAWLNPEDAADPAVTE